MFDRLSASFSLARSAWVMLLEEKKLIIFPLLSGFSCLLVMIAFASPFLISENLRNMFLDENSPAVQSPLLWVVLFLFYFVNYFVVVFFNSALVACALKKFRGEQPTLADGLSVAIARLPQILAWAAVSATVGVLLKMIEGVHEKLGEIISALLGTAWTVVTFFVVPVLVVEQVGPIDAVKRSLSILKKTWGESLVGNFGLGIFTFLLLCPGLGLAAVGVWLLTQVAPVGIAVLLAAVVYFIVWAGASSALNGIFISALYEYAAHGQAPANFEASQMEMAFRTK